MREDVTAGEAAAVRLTTGAPLRDVLAVDDPRAWVSLDAGVRWVAWHWPGRPSEWGQGSWVNAALPQLDEPRLAVALCHRDGRIRERALARAGRHPGLLPLIVIRCADWAAPVRERARQMLGAALDVAAAVALAPVILLVGRRERGAFAVELLGELLRRASAQELARLFSDAGRTVRRFAYRLAVEQQLLSPAELAHAAAHDGDAVLQNLCGEAALAALPVGPDGDAVIDTLLSARNPRARSAGVTALRKAGRPGDAEPFLADRSGLVRACARYVLRQHGTDPLPLYRAWCADIEDPALSPGAATGLAESGNRSDAALLWPLITHPVRGVRAGAVAGLRLLDLADAHRLLPLLDDAAPGVVRETTLALMPSVAQLPLDWLEHRLDAERPRHVRVGAFRLLHVRGGIIRLRAAVELLDDPDPKLRRWAEQSVQRWHPTADVRHGDPEVGTLLDRSAHLYSTYDLQLRKLQAGLRHT
jgi:hypothetical protein